MGADFGENATCSPKAPGLTNRRVTRGGFMNGMGLTNAIFWLRLSKIWRSKMRTQSDRVRCVLLKNNADPFCYWFKNNADPF